LLKSKNFSTVLAAAQSLVKSGEAGTFAPAARALLKNTYFTYEGTTEVLIGYGRSICGPIMQLLKSYSLKKNETEDDSIETVLPKAADAGGEDVVAFVSIMIDLLGFHRYREALPVLAKMLESRDEEIIVHVLKAFLRIGAVPEGFNLKPYLTHKYWVIRSFSAQVWKLTGDESALPLLKNMLSDRQWWVRFHAAEALRSGGEAGFAILKQLAAAAGEDRETAISRYILDINEVS
ncbi:MAG: HEAT repeat domain-containing protein, partial [Dethiobacteria bacterium]|nr:HEAT repeat domain-containing protein [Dethiobacteria bacterium]